MNELLITQIQQTQSHQKTGAKPVKENVHGESEFQRLMRGVSNGRAANKQTQTAKNEKSTDSGNEEIIAYVIAQAGAPVVPEDRGMSVIGIVSQQAGQAEGLPVYGEPEKSVYTVDSDTAVFTDVKGSLPETDMQPGKDEFAAAIGFLSGSGPGAAGTNEVETEDLPSEVVPETPRSSENDFKQHETVSGMVDKAETKVVSSEEPRITDLKEQPEEEKPIDLRNLAIKSLENRASIVKVSDSVDAEKPDFPEKFAEKILFKTEGTAKQFEIELSPRELGKVKVNVVFEKGKAIVTLFCENAKTQQILSSHAASIKTLVESNSKHETAVRVRNDGEARADRDGAGEHSSSKDHQQQGRRPKREEMNIFIDQLKIGILTSKVSQA